VSRPLVVVLGAEAGDRPPGIEDAEPLGDLVTVEDAPGLARTIADADAILSWRARRAWLEQAWRNAAGVRWIQSASDGVDGVLFPALVESDVVLTNARGVFEDAIAEWAIAAILAFRTGLQRSAVDTTRGRWDGERSRERVAGSRLVVVGPGPIGRATARRARGLDIDVTAVGRAPRHDDELGEVHGPSDLETALAEADHVLDALPLTDGTRHLFDKAAFDAMKPGAVFLNVGRGSTVDEPALVDALASGHLGGAALDVFEEEPLPPDSPLWSMANVLVSPHVCGDVEGWQREVVELFLDNLGRFVRGEPLRNVVDKSAGFGIG
jgi:phosphoglycerate dehydrogenase-like enzyme